MTNKKDNLRAEEHRRDLDDLVARFSKEKDLLETRLRDTSSGLEEANKLKVGMQENLRRAFMRGVCALNFEAMSVI